MNPSNKRRMILGQTMRLNFDRLLEAQGKSRYWLALRIEQLDPDIAAESTLSQWLVGKRPHMHRIPAVALPVIAKALKCSVSEFFNEARWVRCDCCKDTPRYWCKLHDLHMDRCPCDSPTIDQLINRT